MLFEKIGSISVQVNASVGDGGESLSIHRGSMGPEFDHSSFIPLSQLEVVAVSGAAGAGHTTIHYIILCSINPS